MSHEDQPQENIPYHDLVLPTTTAELGRAIRDRAQKAKMGTVSAMFTLIADYAASGGASVEYDGGFAGSFSANIAELIGVIPTGAELDSRGIPKALEI